MFSINPIPKCAASPELAVPRKLNVHVSLPPIADVFPNHSFLSTPRETTRETTRECIRESSQESSAKGKRKRVNVLQLAILSRVFSVTSFPSTKLREELARQLGMSPRAVQVWFQNKRQSLRGNLPQGNWVRARQLSFTIKDMESFLLPHPKQIHFNSSSP
ncbi:hypothetical protein DSO57_1020640 [Entomophthora muscae]|uniref:Uncharacterized protein n=1 Tax=Entomophthora muscae TaxID=34485 RepID=A0ACC2RUM4_9FUNG|nr:hypothetical protein DSO57_1020640 [Entomophthora muscae]